MQKYNLSLFKISLLLLAGIKDDTNMAKEVLVLMIVSLTYSWKLPIANFMIAVNLTNYIYKTVFKIDSLMIYRFIWFRKS